MLWEYLTVENLDDDEMNELGSEGWEAISVLWREIDGTNYSGIKDRVLFKRVIEKS